VDLARSWALPKALKELESFSQGRSIAPYGRVWAQQYASRQSGNCEALTFPILGERETQHAAVPHDTLSYLHDVASRTNSLQRMRLSSITSSMSFRSGLLSARSSHRDPAVTAGPTKSSSKDNNLETNFLRMLSAGIGTDLPLASLAAPG
jgi:hypothetical protein